MEIRTTKQSKCNKKQVGEAKTPSMFKRILQVIKDFLRYLLMNPATWRFLMVHVPDLIDKAWQLTKDVIKFFTDLL